MITGNLSQAGFHASDNLKATALMLMFFLFSFTSAAQYDSTVVGRTMQSLRNVKTDRAEGYYITDPGKQGWFVGDPGDTKTPDDSVMTLVAANGMRFKRTDKGDIDVRWFGARGDGKSDDWFCIQKAITFILEHNTASRTLSFPAGTYSLSRPLIIARFTGNSYKQASINLVGPANSKTISAGYAVLAPTFNNTFAIGVQLG
ncbi:MAG TPA: glycosyl hydrolase family 28-related protein, partial [Puia sp.]|nr:glycosyl hydrolase family 28-related protein [Puia sp.]